MKIDRVEVLVAYPSDRLRGQSRIGETGERFGIVIQR